MREYKEILGTGKLAGVVIKKQIYRIHRSWVNISDVFLIAINSYQKFLLFVHWVGLQLEAYRNLDWLYLKDANDKSGLIIA